MKNIIGLLVLVIISGCVKYEQKPPRPNILFILADDMRDGTIHRLGNNQIITPNLDKLVDQGLAFENCYIQGGTCPAICMPSRAMLNTGKNLFSLKRNGGSVPKDHTLLGEHLQNNGYNCFGTGKWHNGKEAFNRSFNFGDAIFMGGMADHYNVPLFHYDSTGTYKNSRLSVADPLHGKKLDTLKGEYCYSGVHSSEVFANAAIDFIEQYSSAKPFFLYTSFTAPHDPRTAPQAYLDLYDTVNIDLPANFLAEYQFDYGGTTIRGEKLVAYPRQEEEIKEHLKDYYALITHMDAQIGRIVQALKAAGKYENTIIILTSDNGIAIGSHAMMGKQDQYEHGIHVPLIFSGKNIQKNKTHQANVQLTDMFPTICDLLELETPQSVEGISFNKAFADSSYKGRDIMYSGYSTYQRAVIKDNYKLIKYNVNGTMTTELFDLKNDPFEINNIASENPEMVNLLLEDLQNVKAEYRDTLINLK